MIETHSRTAPKEARLARQPQLSIRIDMIFDGDWRDGPRIEHAYAFSQMGLKVEPLREGHTPRLALGPLRAQFLPTHTTTLIVPISIRRVRQVAIMRRRFLSPLIALRPEALR